MSSEVIDRDVAAAIDRVRSGLGTLLSLGVDPFDAGDAITMVRELEVIGRQAAALAIKVHSNIDERGLYAADGHGSAKVMVRHLGRLSGEDAHRRSQAARALADLPCVATALAAGRIGMSQVTVITRAHANVRVRRLLCGQDEALARSATMDPFDVFEDKVRDWVRLMDADGARDRNQRSHENRDLRLHQDLDGTWHISGGCASLQGAELDTIHRHFVDVERAADWAEARDRLGHAATEHDLIRTEAQRRADAWTAMARAAATAVGASPSTIVTNIVIDRDTFERECIRFAGGTPARPEPTFDPQPETPGHGADGDETKDDEDDDPDRRRGHPARRPRSHTLDGHWIEPTEAVAAALVGHVRRVVMGSDSVVTDLGRRSRLFTGSAALAVRLASRHCYWPGCWVPVTDCQIDHLRPWSEPGGPGGRTDPGNGAPACGRHNRLKHHGYAAHRDAAGQIRVTRPDGTEID